MPLRLVYLDNVAATPVDPRVLDAMLPFFTTEFGNPQSFYLPGARAKDAMDKARSQVAALIGAQPEEIVFTSSGTESNNLALKGLAGARADKGKHIVVSAVEHASVLNVTKTLGKAGYSVTVLPVGHDGRVNPDDLPGALRPDTILVSVMTANNEIGTIQPIAEIGKITRQRNIAFHTDAVAAAGWIPLDVAALGVDSLSLAAQNFHGPKGVAALYVRKGVRLHAQLEGGVQENNRRAGTENVPGIVGMGCAAELAKTELPARAAKIKLVYVTGHPTERLPGLASFCVEFIEGEGMLLSLDDIGVAAASVSACTSKSLKESHVLIAMGYDHALAQGSLILTLGQENTAEDVDYLLDHFPAIVDRLRGMSPLYARYRKDPAGYEASLKSYPFCDIQE